jgi:hypothetical protein
MNNESIIFVSLYVMLINDFSWRHMATSIDTSLDLNNNVCTVPHMNRVPKIKSSDLIVVSGSKEQRYGLISHTAHNKNQTEQTP